MCAECARRSPIRHAPSVWSRRGERFGGDGHHVTRFRTHRHDRRRQWAFIMTDEMRSGNIAVGSHGVRGRFACEQHCRSELDVVLAHRRGHSDVAVNARQMPFEHRIYNQARSPRFQPCRRRHQLSVGHKCTTCSGRFSPDGHDRWAGRRTSWRGRRYGSRGRHRYGRPSLAGADLVRAHVARVGRPRWTNSAMDRRRDGERLAGVSAGPLRRTQRSRGRRRIAATPGHSRPLAMAPISRFVHLVLSIHPKDRHLTRCHAT